mgnify:CR=1 FL=1
MRRWLAVLALAALLAAPALGTAEEKAAMSAREKVGYSLGADIGRMLKQQGVEVDPQAFAKGFADAMAGGPLALKDEEIREVLQAFQQETMAKQQEHRRAEAAANKKAADAFLAENKGKAGVVTLPSGLQYKVLTEGTGATPKETDTVTVHYRGTLLDGTEFDSSYSRGEPATFPVNGVIKGWTEALQRMRVGAKWQLFIPPELAYGERGAGRVIGPNQALVFEVELLGIK